MAETAKLSFSFETVAYSHRAARLLVASITPEEWRLLRKNYPGVRARDYVSHLQARKADIRYTAAPRHAKAVIAKSL